VSRFGRLDNLVGLKPSHGIELRPFALAEVRHLQAGFANDPRQAGVTRRFSAGLDVKAHPTQNLTIDATVNPDFGQVEADEVVLNLTNIETAFMEKRPFFQEGTDVFQSSRIVVYTRRIGAVPGTPALPSGEQVISRLDPTPIYGALKVTGRPLPRLALGALSALTGPQSVTTMNGDGQTDLRAAAPLTFWNVLRLRSDFGNGGHLGFLGTATNRNESFGAFATATSADGETRILCPGGQRVAPGRRCFRDSYVGGFDGLWRSPSRMYALSGQAMAALVQNGPDRTLRDGTVLGSGSADPLFAVAAEKEGGDLQGRVWGQFTGRQVDFNDLGYMQRQNEWRLWLMSSYRTTKAWGPALTTLTGFHGFQQTNLDGVPVGRWVRLGTNWQLKNFWWVGVYGVYFPTIYDDREVGNGAALEHKPRTGIAVEIMTDPRRDVMGMLEAAWHHLAGGRSYEAEATLRLKLLSQLDLDLAPNVTVRTGEPRYLSRQGAGDSTTYLLGDLAARSVGATLRLTWTFSPRLTLQTYGQAFLVSRRYSDFATFTSSSKKPLIRLHELEAAEAPDTNPDSTEAVFNANVLLRWEYRPGSTLFLAYSRSQRPTGDMTGDLLLDDFRSLSRSLTAGPAANVVLLKLAYWWG
jgi:hypothetical protein